MSLFYMFTGLKCVLIVNLLMTTQRKGITAQLLVSVYFGGNRRFYHVIENNFKCLGYICV